MRPITIVAVILGAGLLAAPVFAESGQKTPAEAAAKAAKRQARLLEGMKKQGIDEAKAKRVIAVVAKFRPEMKSVRTDMKTAKRALEKNDKDKAARDRLQAAKQKLASIEARRDAEIAKILTPEERAKVKELFDRNGKRGRHGKKDRA